MALLVAAGLLAAGAAGPSRKERLAALPDEDRVWLTEYVAPIILPEEEKLFLDLAEGYQREIFKRDFWKRRERDGLRPPFGLGFKVRYEELRPRLDSVYDGWRNDAGRMVLHYGEPADIHPVTGCDKVFSDLEIWSYVNLGWARQTIHHLFYRSQPTAPRKLWQAELDERPRPNPCQGASHSDDVFVRGSCRRDFKSLSCDCSTVLGDPCWGPVCFEACDVYKIYMEIMARQGSPLGGIVETGRLLGLPEVSTEGLELLRSSFATTADPNAKKINVEGPSSKPSTPPEPTPTPEPRHQLSVDEMRDRIVHLEPKYRQWLELAAPLLTLDELSLFLQLSPSEKDKFIRTFWKRQS
jgi:GWxTD domain-containing protein